MNILILSCGTRNKIVQYFKETLKGCGRVIATDMSSIAPALYEADKYYIVPRMTEPGYLEVILDICKNEKINGVLSLIDPELSFLAKHVDDFKSVGTTVIGSDYNLCEISLDKMRMYEFCKENNFKTARSWNNIDEFKAAVDAMEVKFPVFVKPQCGSASIAISKVNNMQTVELLLANASEQDHLMIQEFLDGQEIGADVYIDILSGEVISIFTKKKIVMRAGETDKAVSFKDEKLFDLIKQFVSKSGYRGQIDIDIFEIDGEYYISEVNPRFGGGYPHAYECGVNHMELIKNNLDGKRNKQIIGDYKDNVYMMKYNEIFIM